MKFTHKPSVDRRHGWIVFSFGVTILGHVAAAQNHLPQKMDGQRLKCLRMAHLVGDVSA
jgi:hypothetical protein